MDFSPLYPVNFEKKKHNISQFYTIEDYRWNPKYEQEYVSRSIDIKLSCPNKSCDNIMNFDMNKLSRKRTESSYDEKHIKKIHLRPGNFCPLYVNSSNKLKMTSSNRCVKYFCDMCNKYNGKEIYLLDCRELFSHFFDPGKIDSKKVRCNRCNGTGEIDLTLTYTKKVKCKKCCGKGFFLNKGKK